LGIRKGGEGGGKKGKIKKRMKKRNKVKQKMDKERRGREGKGPHPAVSIIHDRSAISESAFLFYADL